jgi:gluconolactonase
MSSYKNVHKHFFFVAFATLYLIHQAAANTSLRVGPSIVEVPKHWHDVFPAVNFNRDVSTPIWNVSLPNGTDPGLQHDLDAIRNASFVAYNDKFYDLLGVVDYTGNMSYETLFTFLSAPAYAQRQIHDATVYSPECDCIFFNQMYSPKLGESFPGVDYVWRVSNATSEDQSDIEVEKVYPKPALPIPNGAYYHNGSIYWSVEGKFKSPGGIVRMDPITLKTEVVLNNYYGRRFNSPNDVVITTKGIVFFTDGYYGYENFNSTIKPEMANGIWR